MNNEQVISFGAARAAMHHGGTGLAALWFVALLFIVPGAILGSWILVGIGLFIAIPTAYTTYRHRQSRKMWSGPH
jgi:hypothetical protein